jgi:ribosomal protein S8
MLNQIILPFQNAKALKSTFQIIKKSKNIMAFVRIFYKMGLISTYSNFKNKLKLCFNYVNLTLVLQFFRVFKKKSTQFIIKRKHLNKVLVNGNYMILLENSSIRKG